MTCFPRRPFPVLSSVNFSVHHRFMNLRYLASEAGPHGVEGNFILPRMPVCGIFIILRITQLVLRTRRKKEIVVLENKLWRSLDC